MTGLDKFQARAIGNHQRRHEAKIRDAATRIQEYAGYVLRDLDRGKIIGHFADDILSDAQTLVVRLAMLEAMADVTGIIETEDDPEAALRLAALKAEPRTVLHHPGPHSDPVTIDARRNH
jgi:hypothetical protein